MHRFLDLNVDSQPFERLDLLRSKDVVTVDPIFAQRLLSDVRMRSTLYQHPSGDLVVAIFPVERVQSR